MPLPILVYIKGLLAVAEPANCVSMARVLRVAHDRLSKILNDHQLAWQTLLHSLVLRIIGKLSAGYLILDDTVIDKSFAKVVENLAWVFSSKKNTSVFGLNIVVLCWSNGTLTIPLAFKVWKKGGGKTKIDLALELLSYARNFLKLKPKYVVFDSWYAAKKILQRITAYEWVYICQVKKNRLFNGKQLQRYHRHPYWMERGIIYGKMDVLIVRHGKKYFVTNDAELSKADLLGRYKTRWSIETMFRMLYDKLGIEECESRSLRSQTAHITLCFMSFLLLEKTRLTTRKTWYQLRREYRFHPEKVDLLFNELKLLLA